MLQLAVADMFALGKTSAIYAQPPSTYSLAAAWIANVRDTANPSSCGIGRCWSCCCCCFFVCVCSILFLNLRLLPNRALALFIATDSRWVGGGRVLSSGCSQIPISEFQPTYGNQTSL